MNIFKIGSTVEELKNVPLCMWRSGEIVAEKEVEYIVRYDSFLGAAMAESSQRVSREAVGPCPPLMKSVVCREVDNHVEVFDTGYWKDNKWFELERILGFVKM
ncbi:hypothetical protein Nepgr_013733 [Nepenthes gracilis]|uniref:Uncharacterized protein n=1 Tax=Nepenthes gracilis TaxID=150966 RepID=A0AAD3XNX4_NEPGR|nr:hypothetical protein Nepgr_013733 [Nepenthes gracilis]